jgi:hypothetical protein
MIRVAHVSHAFKAIACAPDSWDVLHLHERLGVNALRSLTRTFPNALRSAREIWINVLYRSGFNGLDTFLDCACPFPTADIGKDAQTSLTQCSSVEQQLMENVTIDRIVYNNNSDKSVERVSVSSETASLTLTSQQLSSSLSICGVTTAVAAGGRLPNRRLRRLYLIDTDLCALELATLGVLFPNLDELTIIEHGSGVSQIYDAGSIFTRLLSNLSHLQSLVIRFAGQTSLRNLRAAAVTTLRVPPSLVRLCVCVGMADRQ